MEQEAYTPSEETREVEKPNDLAERFSQAAQTFLANKETKILTPSIYMTDPVFSLPEAAFGEYEIDYTLAVTHKNPTRQLITTYNPTTDTRFIIETCPVPRSETERFTLIEWQTGKPAVGEKYMQTGLLRIAHKLGSKPEIAMAEIHPRISVFNQGFGTMDIIPDNERVEMSPDALKNVLAGLAHSTIDVPFTEQLSQLAAEHDTRMHNLNDKLRGIAHNMVTSAQETAVKSNEAKVDGKAMRTEPLHAEKETLSQQDTRILQKIKKGATISQVVTEEFRVTGGEVYNQKTQYVLTLLRRFIPDFQ